MGKPSMSPIPAGRRGPRREVEAGATNPMETWTRDTAFLSATSHMMWNGKPSKTWWKKKVRCLDKGLTQSTLDVTKRCSIQGHFVWPLQLGRAFGNLCRDLSCTMLLEILWELFGTRVLEEVPLVCQLRSCCRLAQVLWAWTLDWTFTLHWDYQNFLWFLWSGGTYMCKAGPLMWKFNGLGSWAA